MTFKYSNLVDGKKFVRFAGTFRVCSISFDVINIKYWTNWSVDEQIVCLNIVLSTTFEYGLIIFYGCVFLSVFTFGFAYRKWINYTQICNYHVIEATLFFFPQQNHFIVLLIQMRIFVTFQYILHCLLIFPPRALRFVEQMWFSISKLCAQRN